MAIQDRLSIPEQAFSLAADAGTVMEISSRVIEIAAENPLVMLDPADTLIRGRLFEIAAGLATQARRLAEMMTHDDVLLDELKASGLTRLSNQELDGLAMKLIDGAAQMMDPARFIPGRLLVTLLEDRGATLHSANRKRKKNERRTTTFERNDDDNPQPSDLPSYPPGD